MAENITEITDDNFEAEVLNSDKPVIVDFWASWCGPCKAMGPLFEDLANAFSDKVKFAKCNVDDNPSAPSKYGVQAIPTIIFFKDGNETSERIVGMVAKAKFEEALNNL